MKYLSSVREVLDNNNGIKYINILERPDLVYGTPNFIGNVQFEKFSFDVKNDIKKLNSRVNKEYDNFRRCSSGCRIRLKTKAKELYFLVELRRKWDYAKMNLWASSGFDIYNTDGGSYSHKTVFAPRAGESVFWEKIKMDCSEICVFLPLYNEILNLYIGIESTEEISVNEYPDPRPIIFYGNSITQGASASRSGNAFCNIVSRYLNSDIINLSISSCCKGFVSMANEIGKINCKAIVIDYSRNAYDVTALKNTHEKFYQQIRKWHPEIPIIIMSVSNYHNWLGYVSYDEVIKETYEHAIKRGEKTYLLKQIELFEKEEYSLVTLDGIHYTDYGMYRIADKICEILEDNEKL